MSSTKFTKCKEKKSQWKRWNDVDGNKKSKYLHRRMVCSACVCCTQPTHKRKKHPPSTKKETKEKEERKTELSDTTAVRHQTKYSTDEIGRNQTHRHSGTQNQIKFVFSCCLFRLPIVLYIFLYMFSFHLWFLVQKCLEKLSRARAFVLYFVD